MKRAPPFIELLRPQQWMENAFVLVGLVFGHAWGDPALVRSALALSAIAAAAA